VTLIQGGGAGLDQVPAVKQILEAAGARLDWDEHVAGQEAVARGAPPLPPPMLESVRQTGLALKTKLLSTPEGSAGNLNVQFRRELGLFASVRPVKNIAGLPARHGGVNLFIIRELTEDLYSSIEHVIVPGVVQSIKVVTESACRRFFRFAFEWAAAAGRETLTCVHKANILKKADGLFLACFREIARDYPRMQTRDLIVDNCCMQMVLRPQQFDVLVMGNLYGDLVSDLCAGVVGGISATAGINVGDGIRVYEAIHGGPREVIGVGRANPLPLLLPAVELLDEAGLNEPAVRIRRAMETVLRDGTIRTPDLGGDDTTAAMTAAIIAALGA
jgi:isocitrate dehydrogenase (NAD+)